VHASFGDVQVTGPFAGLERPTWIETLELDNLLGQALVTMQSGRRTARKAAARTRARTTRTATTASG